ncbi:hypothetical protein V1281_001903 [Nitrobacteraceae bacterium AZCC 2161]
MTDAPATLFDRSQALPAAPLAAAAPAAPAVPPTAPPGPPPAALPGTPRPEGLAVIKVGEATFSEAELQELAAHKATEDVRKLSLPPAPEGYDLTLPADLVLPEGVSFEFQTEDPFLGPVIKQAQAFAHANGFTQDQFSSMMGLYAASQAHEQATLRSYHDAEVAKLGPAGPARVDAVLNWTKGMIGETGAQALSQMLVTAAHVQAFESLMKKFSSQGASSFTQSHRERPQSGPSSDEFSKWSYDEQRTYQTTGKHPTRAYS